MIDIVTYKNSIKEKHISVIGIGVSNVPLIDFLLSAGAVVTAHDKKDKEQLGRVYSELEEKGVAFTLGEDYLKRIPEDTDIIFKTPGLRVDVPELVAARNRGVEITSEMELFFKLCPCDIIAVTGSDGKTTTTTLIGEMLREEGYTCHIGGNIGKPLIGEVESIKSSDKVVLELSSFQLFSMMQSPKVAVITNVTPNHLDWHTCFDEYIEAKKNIMKFQDEDGTLIVNDSNEISKKIGESARGKVYGFSSKADAFICLKENVLCFGNENILNINDIKIPGMHNVENYMAAIGAVYSLVSRETICKVAREFGGVAHRIEFVREHDGVRYYNDSIASSPARTTAGLVSFGQKVILIAGGYDKKIPFDDFGKVVNDRVGKLILVGATSDKIEAAVVNADNYNDLTIIRETDFKQAVEAARNCAKPGDIVILSPACASFDLFKNFEERGNVFKDIVNSFE